MPSNVTCFLYARVKLLLTNFCWQPFLARVPYQFRSPTQSMIRCPRFNRIHVDPNWATNSITKSIIEHPLWRYDSRVYSTFFIFHLTLGTSLCCQWGRAVAMVKVGGQWEMGQALHMSNERSCTCQIYIAGSRQTTVSDSVPRSLALHVSVMLGALAFTRTNAAGFQREALPIVSMFARFHPWWTQVQVPSSPTSVSSSNEVRKFSLLNLELSLAVGQLQLRHRWGELSWLQFCRHLQSGPLWHRDPKDRAICADRMVKRNKSCRKVAWSSLSVRPQGLVSGHLNFLYLFCNAAATSEAFWARFASVVAEAAQGHSVILGLGEGMSRSLRPWEILYQCTLPDQPSLVKESELR